MTVPLIDWLLPGTRYEWARPGVGKKILALERPHYSSGLMRGDA
jgi:hypothetical protein